MEFNKPTEQDMGEVASVMRSQDEVYGSSCLPPYAYKVALAAGIVAHDARENPLHFPIPSADMFDALHDQRTPEGASMQQAVIHTLKNEGELSGCNVSEIAGIMRYDLEIQAAASRMLDAVQNKKHHEDLEDKMERISVEVLLNNPGQLSDERIKILQAQAIGRFDQIEPHDREVMALSIGHFSDGKTAHFARTYPNIDQVRLNDPDVEMDVKTPQEWASLAKAGRIADNGEEVRRDNRAAAQAMQAGFGR